MKTYRKKTRKRKKRPKYNSNQTQPSVFLPSGAFLIPYFIFLFTCGIPVFFLEVALGQYTSEGGITSWRKISPLFEGTRVCQQALMLQIFPTVSWNLLVAGLGYGTQVIVTLLNFYYIIVLAWGIFYLSFSFSWDLAWSSCNNTWNTGKSSTPKNTIFPQLCFWQFWRPPFTFPSPLFRKLHGISEGKRFNQPHIQLKRHLSCHGVLGVGFLPPTARIYPSLCAPFDALTSVRSRFSAGDECSGSPLASTSWVLWTGTWPCVCSSPGSYATSASGRGPNPQERWVLETAVSVHHFKRHIKGIYRQENPVSSCNSVYFPYLSFIKHPCVCGPGGVLHCDFSLSDADRAAGPRAHPARSRDRRPVLPLPGPGTSFRPAGPTPKIPDVFWARSPSPFRH